MPACLLAADQLPEERDAHRELRVLFGDDVELKVGALQIAGEAQKLGEKPARVDRARIALDHVVERLDRIVETTGLEQLLGGFAHDFPSCSLFQPVGGASSVTSLNSDSTWSSWKCGRR